MMMLIDLTRTIEHNLSVYPGDSHTELIESNQLERDGYSNHQLSINMHAGTHIDGPKHMLQSELYMSDAPLESFIGQGAILDVSGCQLIDYKESYEALIPEQCILILHTGYGRLFGEERYYSEHPALTIAFAQMLVRKRIKMLCLDMPSPDHYPFDVHKILLEHHIWIAENLANVDQLLEVPSFQVIALPMKVKADSAIARIIASVTVPRS